jgi:hypothetical protein
MKALWLIAFIVLWITKCASATPTYPDDHPKNAWVCRDAHRHCDYMVKNGYCSTREQKMRLQCKYSCGFCEMAPK